MDHWGYNPTYRRASRSFFGVYISSCVDQKFDFQDTTIASWWFQILFIFTPTWGRFPIWLIFFKGVETTNQIAMFPKSTLPLVSFKDQPCIAHPSPELQKGGAEIFTSSATLDFRCIPIWIWISQYQIRTEGGTPGWCVLCFFEALSLGGRRGIRGIWMSIPTCS